jgi:hypothetical protein
MTETTGRPRVGVLLPTVDGFRAGAWDIRSFARRAEDLGFDSLWVADHLVFDAPILESVVAAATAAAVTERITIGFGVMQVALRHPAWTAKQLAALQVVSGNGIEFGVGVGANFSAEWSAVGVPVRERAGRTDAFLAALPSLLAGESTALPGPWSTVVPPLTPPAALPPQWIGGRVDATLRRHEDADPIAGADPELQETVGRPQDVGEDVAPGDLLVTPLEPGGVGVVGHPLSDHLFDGALDPSHRPPPVERTSRPANLEVGTGEAVVATAWAPSNDYGGPDAGPCGVIEA